MHLYVCWDTRTSHPIFGEHPCGVAFEALRDAGHDPKVIRAYGWAALPSFLNFTPGRRAVRELTGQEEVPVLVLEDGEVVSGSEQIVFWANANPAQAQS